MLSLLATAVLFGAAEQPTMDISHLRLRIDAGHSVDDVYAQLGRRTRSVCEVNAPGLRARREEKACEDEMIAIAVNALADPRLTAVHEGVSPSSEMSRY